MATIDIAFELFPVFNAGPLFEVDVPVFLDQVAQSLKILGPHSAKLDDLFCFSNEKFIIDPDSNKETEDAANRELIQILTEEKSFFLNTKLSITTVTVINEFMASISKDQNRFIIFWQFDLGALRLLTNSREAAVSPLSADSFAFGNLINGNRFVTHLNDLGTTFNAESVASNCNILSDVFVEVNGKFHVSFKINYFDRTCSSYDSKRCSFQFDASSVTGIDTCMREQGVEFYFHLDFPPRLFLSDDEGASDEYTSRWVDSDLISREVIGRCNTFMLRFDFNSSSDIVPILTIVYSDFFTKNLPIICTTITTYCIEYSDELFENNFPFEVKYALECINSLSNAFRDDLYINGNKNNFYNLIQAKIEAGQMSLVVEKLYSLFQEYVDNEVENAYLTFTEQFRELNEEMRDIRTNFSMKKIILTPMRTIYLPPSPCRTRYMFENVDTNHMIIVYFRDDDKSHTSFDSFNLIRGMGESDFTQFLADSQYRKHFFEEIVQRRLFTETGLISPQPLKYVGTGVSKVFNHGMIVKANVRE